MADHVASMPQVDEIDVTVVVKQAQLKWRKAIIRKAEVGNKVILGGLGPIQTDRLRVSPDRAVLVDSDLVG